MSLSVADVYHILFRHKWKIILFFLLGIGGAVAVKMLMPVPYKSSAKLFIRYVLEAQSPAQLQGDDARVRTPDSRGENIINTELEILTSLDLARQAAEAVGPEKILAPFGGGSNAFAAAGAIRSKLTVEVPRRSNVILLSYEHPNAEIPQQVLTRLIGAYLSRHAEVHRSVGVFDKFLMQETDQLRARLNETEDELRRAKTNAGIISVEESRRALGAEIAQVRESLLAAETELAERRAVMAQLTQAAPVHAAPATVTNASPVSTDLVQTPPPEVLQEYRRVAALIESLRVREQELLQTFTASNSLVQAVRRQIDQNTQLRRRLETDHQGLLAPGVASVVAAAAVPAGLAPVDPQIAINAEVARVSGIESRIKILTGQLERLRQEASIVEQAEGPIAELQRRKELQENQYKYFSSMLERTRWNEALGSGRVSNISEIQVPSPPSFDEMSRYKVMAAVLLGSFALGLGLAFLLEMYLDRSVKRPGDIEGKLGLPLFMSVPYLNGHLRARRLAAKSRPLLAERTSASLTNDDDCPQPGDQRPLTPSPAVSSPAVSPAMAPFSEALRDRLITWFEVKGLTHKPKLVALTSCGKGAGVSTVAAGLAASLSETGEGNVLLVDMNQQDGAAHQFRRGDLACDIDDALEAESRDGTLVAERLYVVSEGTNSERLPSVLPRRFQGLVPKLKASDFDYIIFDMPPVSQVSLTPRLSRFMDMVLMVVESEETDKDVLKRATGLLAESRANVGIVLNKTRRYVPRILKKEL